MDGGESFHVGENKITARWLNHPQGCLGYRIETPAGTVVYATDNEPGNAELDKNLRELADGADIFINDAQYTPEQLADHASTDGDIRRGKKAWRAARDAGAKTLVLFHHDPDSTDRAVDTILRNARDEFDSVFAASEGMVITLGSPGDHVQAHLPGTRTAMRREAQFRALVSGVTEGGKPFEEETVVRDLALQGALITLEHAPRLQSELLVTMESAGHRMVQADDAVAGLCGAHRRGFGKGTSARWVWCLRIEVAFLSDCSAPYGDFSNLFIKSRSIVCGSDSFFRFSAPMARHSRLAATTSGIAATWRIVLIGHENACQ